MCGDAPQVNLYIGFHNQHRFALHNIRKTEFRVLSICCSSKPHPHQTKWLSTLAPGFGCHAQCGNQSASLHTFQHRWAPFLSPRQLFQNRSFIRQVMAANQSHALALALRGHDLAATTQLVIACTPTPLHHTPELLAHSQHTSPLNGLSVGAQIWAWVALYPVSARVLVPRFGY